MMEYRFSAIGPRELLGLDKEGFPKHYVLNAGDLFFSDIDWSRKRDYEEVVISPVTEEPEWNTIRDMDFDDAKALTGIRARSWADLETKWRAL